MNRTRRIRRAAGVLAALASAALAPITAAPAAFASVSPGRPRLLSWADPPLPPGWNLHLPRPDPARVHAVLAGGMPGWQTILIAATAALFAGALTVTARRIRARRRLATSAA